MEGLAGGIVKEGKVINYDGSAYRVSSFLDKSILDNGKNLGQKYIIHDNNTKKPIAYADTQDEANHYNDLYHDPKSQYSKQKPYNITNGSTWKTLRPMEGGL